jgi:putative addiction module antidote
LTEGSRVRGGGRASAALAPRGDAGVPISVAMSRFQDLTTRFSAALGALKLTRIGTSTGVIIPKEMLARMNLAKGDSVYLVEAPDGGYRLTPYDPAFARKMEKADDIMRRYRNTLHVLAQ